jgi:iron complex transport system ATP-binding protein
MNAANRPVLYLEGLSVRRSGVEVLREIDWQVMPGERWALLGPNGAGKTTLLMTLAGRLRPSKGLIEVLGSRRGRDDVRSLWSKVAVVSASLQRNLRPSQSALEVVLTAKSGYLEHVWDQEEPADQKDAIQALEWLGISDLADRPWGVLSQGEQQRVMLARALASQARLVVLDEPAAGLDLGGRALLLDAVERLCEDAGILGVVMAVHHIEEIPSGVTHVLILKDGGILAKGEAAEVLGSSAIEAAFGVPVRALRDERPGGRWLPVW